MYNGVGIRTPRGTATSGYVQKNFASVPKARQTSYERMKEMEQSKQNTPKSIPVDQTILEHDRKRQVEVRLMEWADDNGFLDDKIDPEELEAILSKERERIAAELEREARERSAQAQKKEHSTHQREQRKAEQHAQFGSALGVRQDYVEGQAFDRDLQEQRKQERIEQRLADEKRKRDDKKRVEEEERLSKTRRLIEDAQRDREGLERDEERNRKKRKHRSSRSRSPSRSRSASPSRSRSNSRNRSGSDNDSDDGRSSSKKTKRSP